MPPFIWTAGYNFRRQKLTSETAAAAWKIGVGKGLKLTQNYEQKVEERGNGLCNLVCEWTRKERKRLGLTRKHNCVELSVTKIQALL